VGEPRHPAAQEAAGVRKRSLHPEVAASGVVERTAQLGIGHGREQSNDPIQEEDEKQRWAGNTSRDACQHEDSSANHRADANHRDVDQPHLAAQTYFHPLINPCWIFV